MKFLGQAGFETNEIVQAMPGLLDLATAGMLGLGEAADITSNIMSGFGLEAEESARIADVLAAASSSANTNVQQLGEGMKFVAPVASALGISVESTAAAMGVLSDAGLQSSMAGTGLRRVLSELANTSTAGQKVLENYGLTLEELNPQTNNIIDIVQRLSDAGLGAAEAFTIFGDRGAPAILALTSQTDRLRELNAEMENSKGRAGEMADVMANNLAGDIKILKSAIEELTLAGGERGLNGMFRELTQTATVVFQAIAHDIDNVSFKELFIDMQTLEEKITELTENPSFGSNIRLEEMKGELEELKGILGDEIAVGGFGALGRLDLELKTVMNTLSAELTELQNHPIRNADLFGIRSDAVEAELATVTAAYEKAVEAQSVLARAQAEEQKVLDADAAEAKARAADKEEAIRQVTAARKIAEQQTNLGKVEESLKNEEQLVRDSYNRRLQIVLDNTEEGSQVRADLSEKLQAQLDQELETLTFAEDSKIESLRVSLLTQEEALLESYEARKAIIMESTTATETEKAALLKSLDKKLVDDRGKMDRDRWKSSLSAFDDFQQNMQVLAKTGNKELAAVYKAGAIANATIKTYEAANVALASAPPPFSFLLAGAAVAAGLANVSAITSTNAGSFAAGGQIREGQFGLVGEAGPEIVRGPATITSAQDTSRMMGGGSKPSGTIVHVNNYGNDEVEVTESRLGDQKLIEIAVRTAKAEINAEIRSGSGDHERALQSRDRRVG